MKKEIISGQSRDEILERILEETARNPYRPGGSAKLNSSSPSGSVKDRYTGSYTPNIRPALRSNPPVNPRQTERPAEAPRSSQSKPQPAPANPDITQVFSATEAKMEEEQLKQDIMSEKIEAMRQQKLSRQKIKNDEILKDDEPSVKVYQKPPTREDHLSPAEKIKKLHQEKAAAAKAAIQQKADIENARRAQQEAAMLPNDEELPGSIYADEAEDGFEDNEKVNLFIPPEDEEETSYRRDALTEASQLFQYCISFLFIVYLIFGHIMNFTNISGDSMLPTLNDGDSVLVMTVGYTPQSGDLVVIDDNTAALLDENGKVTEKTALECRIVKRIIAVGGDTLDIDFEKGEVKVNGGVLNESYIKEMTTRDEGAFTYPLTIPEGYVFVMGDNRNISKDSRHPEVGLVPEDEIIGKVMMRVYPFGEFGKVE